MATNVLAAPVAMMTKPIKQTLLVKNLLLVVKTRT